MIDTFESRLAFGNIGESLIARWLIHKCGASLLPIYASMTANDKKGPRVFAANGNLVAPDLLIKSSKGVSWVEAKHKTVFSWYRKKCQWETGIDQHHFRDYQRVAELFGFPVWLLFLHTRATPDAIDAKYDSCPPTCPTGLFGGRIDELAKYGRTDARYGRHGMIYWPHGALTHLATFAEVQEQQAALDGTPASG